MADYQGKLRGAQIDTLPEEIEKKQDKLHVTLLNNGNVRIDFGNTSQDFMPATPSGDPMHYAYEAVGAVWNGSTGFWEYRAADGGLTDLTNADMQVCYSEAHNDTYPYNSMFANIKGRTTFNNAYWGAVAQLNNAFKGPSLEVAFLARGKNFNALPTTLTGSFTSSSKLRKIVGNINLQYMVANEVINFIGCSALESVTITNLKNSINFSHSPYISKETVLYAIENAAPTSQIVITLSGKVYASMIQDVEIRAALAAQPLITLASA